MSNEVDLTTLKHTRFEFIKKRIDELKKVDLAKADIDHLKWLMRNLFRSYIDFPLQIDKKNSLYRARRHDEKEKGAFVRQVSDIYPSAKFITKLGRANRERNVVFYFSADPMIAMRELQADIGDEFSVVECKASDAEPCLLSPIGIREMAHNRQARIGGNLPEPIERLESRLECDSETLEKWQAIDSYIADEFLKEVNVGDEYLYKSTIAIAEIFWTFGTDQQLTGGITYPSLKSDRLNANVAFLPDAFNRTYKPVGCRWVRIEEERDRMGFLVSEIVADTIEDDGSLIWPAGTPPK